jgi:hypothetical protein
VAPAIEMCLHSRSRYEKPGIGSGTINGVERGSVGIPAAPAGLTFYSNSLSDSSDAAGDFAAGTLSGLNAAPANVS